MWLLYNTATLKSPLIFSSLLNVLRFIFRGTGCITSTVHILFVSNWLSKHLTVKTSHTGQTIVVWDFIPALMTTYIFNGHMISL